MANCPKPKTARMTSEQRSKAERKLARWGDCPGQGALPIPTQPTKDTRR